MSGEDWPPAEPQAPLCFTSETPGAWVALSGDSSQHLEYSTDGKQTWTAYAFNDQIPLTTSVYFRCPEGYSNDKAPTLSLSENADIKASGSVMTLLTKDGGLVIPSDYCFTGWISNNSASLTQAPDLPATTLTEYCYAAMFEGTSLTAAPALPATTLTEYCYVNMFQNCTSLTAAPELPAA